MEFPHSLHAFRTALLNEPEDRIGPSFKKVKAKCYTLHKQGFYIYAKPNLCDPKVVAKYIGRYGGLYARHRKIDSKLHRVISKEKHKIYHSFTRWRTAIFLSFGYDPLDCPKCNHKLEFLELYHNHKGVALEEMYEKVMFKSCGKRSSA